MSSTDHIIAACGRLRVAWGWLATAATPGRGRRNQRILSERAIEKRNQHARAERADRHAILVSGKVPTGATTVPADLTVLEAREEIAREVDHTTSVMGWQMRRNGYNTNYRPDRSSTDARFKSGIDWISMNAPRLHDQRLINDVYKGLNSAETLARNVLGEGPDQRRLAAECPACERRTLAWDTSSDRYEEWHIACTAPTCRCQGRDCACKMPERQHGATHVWLESAWNRLAQQLEETA